MAILGFMEAGLLGRVNQGQCMRATKRILWAVSPAALLVTSACLCTRASSEAITRIGATALMPGLALDGMFRGNTNTARLSGSIVAIIGSLLFWSFIAYSVVAIASAIARALRRNKNDIRAD
jgi:hypothetical protein